jgi:NAD(P)-dependent dehydrogenase (short-subunit alcohol dehydrogenase family)
VFRPGAATLYLQAMKTALITGVGRSGQVGEAVAARLAEDGFQLVVVDRDLAVATERAKELERGGASVRALSADLSDVASVDALFGAIDSHVRGSLDALVHLAGGFAMTGPLADMQVADWDRQLSINLRTAFLTLRGSIPLLRKTKGSAVLFSSESAIDGAKLSNMSAYAVAKSAVRTLMVAASQEERKTGVRINALAPAAIRTAANTAAMTDGAAFVEREDVAATVSWLCSDQSRSVTGQLIRLTPRS